MMTRNKTTAQNSLQDRVAAGGTIFALALSGLGQAIALATLIFSGPLQGGLPRATTNFMLATAVGMLVIGWRSKLVPIICTTQDGPAVVLVAVAAGIAARHSENPETAALVTVGLVTAVSAVLMMVIGHFGLSNIVRYLPTTVVSAFVAGTGWLLAKGGFDVMTKRTLGVGDLQDLLWSEQVKFWMPGFVLGVVVLLVGRTPRVPKLVPSCLPLVAIAGFYAITTIVSSRSVVQDEGWLIGPFPSGVRPDLLTPQEVADLNWAGFLSDMPGVLSVVLVAVVALLLNLTGLESHYDTRVDLDHETKVSSLANFLIVPLGGSNGFHGLGVSALARELGATSRTIPIGTGVLAVAFALFGGELVGLVPRFVIGGLLVTVGLALLTSWVSGLRATTSRARSLFSIGIVFVIAFVGILEGIGAGLLVAIAIFVFEYSKIDPVRLAGDGNQFRSRVDRSPDASAALDPQREHVAVYRLQGYLFFGALTQLADRIRTRCDSEDTPLSAVVIDFGFVTGVDWSGYSLLAKLGEEIEAVGATVGLTALTPTQKTQLIRAEPGFVTNSTVTDTLDQAMEAVEANLLANSGSPFVKQSSAPQGLDLALSDELRAKFDAHDIPGGTTITRQGQASDTLHVVVAGEFSAFRTDDAGSRRRLRRFGAKATIGELGLITKGVRSADVVADTDAKVLTMSLSAYESLRLEHPELALELQDLIMLGQAERVVTLSNHLTQALR